MLQPFLKANERLLSVCSFAMMGATGLPEFRAGGEVGQSCFVSDSLIHSHPRFPTMAGNVRQRRGSKVFIKVPLYQDTNTPKEPQPGDVFGGECDDEKIDPTKEIYMDHQLFGMGCCCLQVTFQCRSIREARQLYDQHSVLAPIMLALTAATPFLAGKVADTDVRWDTIAQSVDDRTPRERGALMTDEEKEEFKKTGKLPKGVINKSRYDSIDCYISRNLNNKDKYDDLDLVYNEDAYKTLIEHGIDDKLAKHVAHLYIRDPLVMFSDRLEQDDANSTDHFESINSTNWHSVRFKPPIPGVDIGWRVEFRTMEVQLTDFENAAFTTFIALLSRAMLFFDLNFYIPISKSDANMRTAHMRDAARRGKFYMRKDIQLIKKFKEGEEVEAVWKDGKLSKGVIKEVVQEGKDKKMYKVAFPEYDNECLELPKSMIVKCDDDYELMTMKDIMVGKDGQPGLIAVVETYLELIRCDSATMDKMNQYLSLIRARASGTLLTTAQWFREFLSHHPSYEHDSRLNHRVNYDLVNVQDRISKGELYVPRLLGKTRDGHKQFSAIDSLSGTALRGASFMVDDDQIPAGESQIFQTILDHQISYQVSGSPAFTSTPVVQGDSFDFKPLN